MVTTFLNFEGDTQTTAWLYSQLCNLLSIQQSAPLLSGVSDFALPTCGITERYFVFVPVTGTEFLRPLEFPE